MFAAGTAYVAFVVVLVVLFRGVGRPDAVLRYFVVTIALFYGLRATILLLHLDTPEPSQFFTPGADYRDLATTLWYLVAFFVILLVGFLTWRSLENTHLQIFVTRPTDLHRMLTVTVVLTSLATAVTVGLLAHFHGANGLLIAGKVGGGLSGIFVLRTFGAVGAILAAATVVDARARSGSHRSVMVAMICAILNSYYVYLWGTRTVALIAVVIVALGWQRARSQRDAQGLARARARRGAILRITVAAALVVVGAVVLRAERAKVLSPRGDVTVANANIWGHISLATDATYLDASMLAFQDSGHSFTYPTGVDFSSAVKGLVPGFLWPGKDTTVSGKRFRQIYQPKVINGWPVGAPTSWYLNFGLLGLIFGAYLSGVMLSLLVAAHRRATDSGYNLGVSLVTVALVFQLGVGPDSLPRAVLWLLPLIVVGRLITRPAPRGAPAAVAATRPQTAAASA